VADDSNGDSAITDEEVTQLLPALAEAERATEATAARFVPPRPGILEEVSARRHQLVYGRRGVGKSTLLHRVAAGGAENGRAVIFVDIETLRGRPYPDVLIELLKELLDHLEERLRADGRFVSWKRRKLRRRVRELSEAMSQLLQEPQLAEHTVSTLRSRARQAKTGWSLGAGLRLAAQHRGVGANVTAAGQMTRAGEQSETAQATIAAKFEKTKMDGLVEAAILVRDVLGDAQKELAVPTLVVLDDFYHIPLDDQPEVLAYLHQVVKGLDISLKVCGVRRRLKPYAAGDPPVGMQPEHDAGTIPLDITLERFEVAKEFLERVLAGIITPLGIELDRLITDGGRERLVLASGGVARDYLSLVRRALRNATERPSHQWRVKNRITAEDVAQAATALYEQKQEELKQDAGDEAEALRSRLSEIVRFCVETHRTNVFLVETTKLQEETWGKDVQALADLRFIHRVDTLSTKRGGETYAGRKFAAFTLDLSTWTSTRSEQISPISFWEREGRQKIRDPSFWEREGRQKIRDPKLIFTPALDVPAATAESPLEAGEQLTFEFEDAAAVPVH
jgi:Cdc6-like AAA superfamily ATPase